MKIQNITACVRSAIKGRLLISFLIVLSAFLLPARLVTAQSELGDAEEPPCVQCHPTEAATWQHSSHAQALSDIEESLHTVCSETAPAADCECLNCHMTYTDASSSTEASAHGGVTCEACHGSYSTGHPQEETMQLQVNSSGCQDCHTNTYHQWQESAHADSNVQCIGCHLPHSQEMRVQEDELCTSCHREHLVDWTHKNADVQCIDCHLSSHVESDEVQQVSSERGNAAPNHDFGQPVVACAGCHEQSIHTQTVSSASASVDSAQMAIMAERAKELAYELDDAEQTNRSLQSLSVISLGFGLGVGGVLGVIFTLVVGYISQKGARA